MEEGSSATDFVTDVTDVTDGFNSVSATIFEWFVDRQRVCYFCPGIHAGVFYSRNY